MEEAKINKIVALVFVGIVFFSFIVANAFMDAPFFPAIISAAFFWWLLKKPISSFTFKHEETKNGTNQRRNKTNARTRKHL